MIIEDLNKYYEKIGNSGKHAAYFYITDVSSCPRALYFSMTGEEGEKINIEGIRRMKMGNKLHESIVGDLFSAGVRIVASEISIPENDFIHGRADVIISHKNELVVVDIKSIAGYGYKLITDNKLNSEHIDQVNLYLHFFNLKKGLIIYTNKNTQELIEIPVEYNELRALELLENLKILKQKINKKEIPDIPENIESWKCSYCKFKETCKVTK